jgi:Putative Actinobacterial Holin-X, holin superfamily III
MSDDNVHDDLRDRPIGQLLKQLSQETTTLVRQGARARQGRMAEKGRRAGLGAGMFGGAGVAALIGRGALTDAIIAALDTAMALAGRP